MPAKPAAPALTYDDFLRDVPLFQRPEVDAVHDFLTARGCGLRLKPAKNGCVVSYLLPGDRKTLANLVFRKPGVTARLYADHAGRYEHLLAALPGALRSQVAGAAPCKRLNDPTKCSPHCRMGNVFTLDGVLHKKCRFNNFLFLLTEESTPHVLALLGEEMRLRGGQCPPPDPK